MTLTQIRADIEALKRQESYASAMALAVHCADEIARLTAENELLRSYDAFALAAKNVALRQHIAELELDCNSVRIHNKALERDAKRYRWIRFEGACQPFQTTAPRVWKIIGIPLPDADTFDAAIDAAMEAKQ